MYFDNITLIFFCLHYYCSVTFSNNTNFLIDTRACLGPASSPASKRSIRFGYTIVYCI